jgi:hypothetical protein
MPHQMPQFLNVDLFLDAPMSGCVHPMQHRQATAIAAPAPAPPNTTVDTVVMSGVKTIGARAALVLVVTGLLTLFWSFGTWGSCPTTPCGGIWMSISHYFGIDLGFGVVTAVAGLGLAAIGLGALRRKGISRFATNAVLLALVIVVTAGLSVIWMYVIPGDDKDFRWPPFIPILVGVAGLIALAASVRLGRSMARRE